MAIELQVLLDAAANAGDDTTPADAIAKAIADGELSRDEVDTLQDEAIQKFGDLRATNPSSDEAVRTLELLVEVSDAARAEATRLDTVSADQQARIDALEARMTKKDGDEAAPADDAPADDAPSEEAVADDAPTEEPADTAADAPADAPVEAVAASAGKAIKPVRLSSIRSAAREPLPSDHPSGISITAAAEVQGFSTGQDLGGIDGLAQAAVAKIAALPENGTLEDIHIKAHIAQMRVKFPTELVASGNNDSGVIEHAADMSRLGDGPMPLVAAGGWCAPSEVLYDLAPRLEDESSGLIDVPDIQVTRGGIRTAVSPDYSAVFAGAVGQIQTEAQAIAGTAKTVYRVPCTTFTETRLDVIYTGIEAGILQNDAYPELTVDHVSKALAAHAHKYNAATISRMVSASDVVDMSALGPSAVGATLNALGLLIKHGQYKYRANKNLMFEVVLPEWLSEVIRADYALRSGIALEQVTDEQINSWFAARKAKPQWVYDWQDAFSGVSAGFGGTSPVLQYPTSVKALVYPAGTFVRGRGEVVNLDGVYDSTNIKLNDFLRLFVEEKILVHKRAYTSWVTTIPVAVNGVTGAPAALDGNGKKIAA